MQGEVNLVSRSLYSKNWSSVLRLWQILCVQKPSTKHPYIPGLLDPCTNSKLCPNIPAEKLYDKEDNGLRLGNSWKGYYVLLNPDYKAQVRSYGFKIQMKVSSRANSSYNIFKIVFFVQVQWRFVNRAIDEVENGNVPAVVLVSRNSTDTGYYQRLRPYPRVLLRRQSIKFKNYENTPIGFGIVVFCIAREQNCQDLFGRFVEAFAPYGEPNMAVDEGMDFFCCFHGAAFAHAESLLYVFSH